MQYRIDRNDPLENHIATITEFINCYRVANEKERNKHFWRFSAYVILASWEKMYRRIMNWTSKGFFFRLKNVLAFDIKNQVRKHYQAPMPKNPDDNPYKTLHKVMVFLTTSEDNLASLESVMSQLQHTNDIILVRNANPELPFLCAALEAANRNGYDPNNPVYNENTCMEFHSLLIALFWGYGRALESLSKAAKRGRQMERDKQFLQGKKQKKEAKAKAGVEAEGGSVAGVHVHQATEMNPKAVVWTYARLLWRVTSSHMFKDHLEILGRITTFKAPEAEFASEFLSAVDFEEPKDSCIDSGIEEEDVEEEEDVGEEEDVEEEMRMGISATADAPTPNPASELFKNWTYLNTSYFSALRLLVVGAASSPKQGIETALIVANHRAGRKHPAINWHNTIYRLCEHPSGQAQPPENSTPSSNPGAEVDERLQPPNDSQPLASTTPSSHPDAHDRLEHPSGEGSRSLAATTPFSRNDAERAIALLQHFIDNGDDKELKILASFGRNVQKPPAQSNDSSGTGPLAKCDDETQKPFPQSGREKSGVKPGYVSWVGNPHCESVAVALLRYLSSAVPDVSDELHMLFSVRSPHWLHSLV